MKRTLSLRWLLTLIAALTLLCSTARAELKTPTVIGSGMVLQCDMNAPVWGWATPDAKVEVAIADQTKTATADKDGRWSVKLDPMPASAAPKTMTISSGDEKLTLENILVGEVWVCSGQSNMQWTVSNSNDAEKEIAAANYPNIRLFQVPLVGTQEPQYDCNASWKPCSPETVPGFSAVGYFFGRKLYQDLDVPVGLIQSCWGGSACEAWVNRDVLNSIDEFKPLMDRWVQTEATFDWDKIMATYKEKVADWEVKQKAAQAEGKSAPPRPRAPRNQLAGQHRPANCYNGMILPIMPYGIRGAIWYQGESNAGRAYQYRTLFPTMIENWRDEWQQGDFPFYFVQLANFMARKDQPAESAWAELREAQTMTVDAVPNAGQAVIIDIGEATNIHPKNKQDVGKRLALIALANDYGQDVEFLGPTYKSLKVDGNKAIISFNGVGGGLVAKGGEPLVGFAIAGEDKQWVWADAVIDGDKVVVSSPDVKSPVAVRYAWADNPACNLYNKADLPACPFRTDDWPGVTIDSK